MLLSLEKVLKLSLKKAFKRSIINQNTIMTNFTPTGSSAKILSDELEKKIEEVNASMVDARNKTEQFQDIKNKLEVGIRELEETKGKLDGEISLLRSEKESLGFDLQGLKDEIEPKKVELADLRKQTGEAKVANEAEKQKLVVEKEEIAKRKSDLDGQESILRTYAKGLEEKEKKLDVYADRVKRLLDSVKPE